MLYFPIPVDELIAWVAELNFRLMHDTANSCDDAGLFAPPTKVRAHSQKVQSVPSTHFNKQPGFDSSAVLIRVCYHRHIFHVLR
jgi:hypothetical protein